MSANKKKKPWNTYKTHLSPIRQTADRTNTTQDKLSLAVSLVGRGLVTQNKSHNIVPSLRKSSSPG